MKRFLYPALLAGAASMLLLAGAAGQQPQNKDSGQAQGETQGAGAERHGRRSGALQRQRQHMAALVERLNLTDAQKKQFQEISRNMFSQGMAIRRDASLTDDQKKEKIQALRKQAHQQMFAVLTPEQKEQLKQMREQHEKELEKKKGPGDEASAKKKAGAAPSDDDDPFAGMTSEDDDEPLNGGLR